MWPFRKNVSNNCLAQEPQLVAPLSGRVIELEQVPDQVFSSGLMGPGIAIVPASGQILAPFDGEVVSLFPTGHAIGLRAACGVECLIHFGMDTVDLGGKGFTLKVAEGDKVRQGAALIVVDLEFVAAAGKNLVTPIVITNSNGWSVQFVCKGGEVRAGADVLFRFSPVAAES